MELQTTATPVIVSTHALHRIYERSGQTPSIREIQEIVWDRSRRVGTVEGAFLCAGDRFVLVVARKRGRYVVKTALTAHMIADNLFEEDPKTKQRDFRCDRAWQRDQASAYAEAISLLDQAACFESRVSTPVIPGSPPRVTELVVSEPLLQTKVADTRVTLTEESCRFCRTARKARGLSQQELADRLGVKRATIKRIECGQLKTLTQDVADRLHSILCAH